MSVQTKIENFLNYITGSNNWPTNTNVGIVTGIDYIVEQTTNNVYFNEMNTNVGMYGSYSEQSNSFNLIADYANEKGCTTAYIYGISSNRTNPSFFQQPLISESFARHNISVNFEYNNNTTHTYFSQRENNDYTGSFHLFIQSPWYSDDNLLDIVSGSFNKNTFRTILNSSPESTSLIPLFDTSSFTTSNDYHPDFVIKDPTRDSTPYDNSILFHKYISDNSTYQNAVDSGSYLIESYIVPSGSTIGTQGYLKSNKMDYLMTPDKQILLRDSDKFDTTIAPKFILSGDRYHIQNALLLSTASGSNISMYDDSSKQVQDVEVGDVVKSYKPVGMPDEFFFQDWLSYSTTNLSGSVASGSVVVRTFSDDFYGYYLLNGSIKMPSNRGGARYFVKQSDTWSWKTPEDILVGNYFLDKDGNEVEVTSKTEVAQEETFYSLDVEDIDTYFTSDILVHNIPPGKCFTGDTMVTLADGTYERIENVKLNQEIKTFDTEENKLQNSIVTEVVKVLHDNLVKYKFDDNTEITATDDHPFYVGGDYKPLEVGDEVLTDELNKIKVVSVETIDGVLETYNINRTDNGKNYFVNKVLVSDESETE